MKFLGDIHRTNAILQWQMTRSTDFSLLRNAGYFQFLIIHNIFVFVTMFSAVEIQKVEFMIRLVLNLW